MRYKANSGYISNYEKCLDCMLSNDIDLYICILL